MADDREMKQKDTLLVQTRWGAAYRPHGFLQYNIDANAIFYRFPPEFAWILEI